MNVFGMLDRIPVPGFLYRMHPDHYDPSDTFGHPVLVTWVDAVRRRAEVVTRTSKPKPRSWKWVPHRPGMHPEIDQTGWFRIADPKMVAYAAFSEPDTEVLGRIEDDVWDRVQLAVAQREGQRG